MIEKVYVVNGKNDIDDFIWIIVVILLRIFFFFRYIYRCNFVIFILFCVFIYFYGDGCFVII